MSTATTGRILFVICLLITCTILWSAHTFYFLLHYLQGYEKTTKIRTSYDKLSLPSALFCNRFPFTQPGLDRLGSAFNQPIVIDYLQNWLDPSLAGAPQTFAQNATFLQQAEFTISQTLLGQQFKDRLDSTLTSCSEMISGCSVQGNRINGIECCTNHVQSYLATMHGLCWLFNVSSNSQNAFDVYQNVRIDFRISRTNFDPISHPGIDVYLLPSNYNALRIATELGSSTPTHLRSKMGSGLRLRKKTYSYLERSSDCGYTLADASHADKESEKTISGYVTCVVKFTIKACKCVPLNVVLWVYKGDFSGQVISELNATSICTVGEYNKCARAYMSFTQPERWSTNIPSSKQQLKNDIENCKNQYHLPCQSTEYEIKPADYSLSSDLQASNDFVSSLSYGFESLEVENEVTQQGMTLFELATYAGWNMAFWLAIALIIWIIFITSCYHRSSTSQQPTKVSPGPSMVSEQGSPASRPDSGQNVPLVHASALPPVNSARSNDSNLHAQRSHLHS